jgi:transcriptional regulator with XRE-family HTH domain
MAMRKVTPLKLAIVASGRPQKTIAAEIGIDEARFSRIVNGLHADEATRQAIADALDRQVDDLFPDYQQAA